MMQQGADNPPGIVLQVGPANPVPVQSQTFVPTHLPLLAHGGLQTALIGERKAADLVATGCLGTMQAAKRKLGRLLRETGVASSHHKRQSDATCSLLRVCILLPHSTYVLDAGCARAAGFLHIN
jgi:hypothetical protein